MVTYTPYPTSTPKNTPIPTPTPSPSPTLTPNPTFQLIQATVTDAPNTYLSVYGNVNSSEVSSAVIKGNQFSAKTSVSLTFTGVNEVGTFCKITVPKQAVLNAAKPTVYINNQVADDQGFTQDAQNFYVWYTSYLSTYEVSIVFLRSSDFLFSIPIVIIAIVLVLFIIVPKIKTNNTLKYNIE
jgi:hypothetical protein